MKPLRLGISACLLGAKVRYDAGHKRDSFLVDTLGPYVEWVPVCPEEEAGMGTPREPVRLTQLGEATRMVGVRSAEDWTERMERFSGRRAPKLTGLCGYVFKRASPSCGVFRVKRYRESGGPPSLDGTGLFATAFRAAHPLVPLEEEGRLCDPGLREQFVERILAHARLLELRSGRPTLGKLVAHHTAHKLQLMAHSPKGYTALGKLVASGKALPLGELLGAYEEGFAAAMAQAATPSRHVNVLQHALGYFKKQLSADEKQEVQELLADYVRGLVPLIVPITLLRHFVRKYDAQYLAGQLYLSPHPKELMLRNHA